MSNEERRSLQRRTFYKTLKDIPSSETKLNYYSVKCAKPIKSLYCTINANVSLQQGVPFERDRSVRRSWCQVGQIHKSCVRFHCPLFKIIYLPQMPQSLDTVSMQNKPPKQGAPSQNHCMKKIYLFISLYSSPLHIFCTRLKNVHSFLN